MTHKPSKAHPLTVSEQEAVVRWLPTARAVARRYAHVMAYTGAGSYDDAYGVASEALCLSVRGWQPSRDAASPNKLSNYAYLVAKRAVRKYINQSLTGAVNKQFDPEDTSRAVQAPGDVMQFEAHLMNESPYQAADARMDVTFLASRACVPPKDVASLILWQAGYQDHEHPHQGVCRQRVQQKRHSAMRRLQAVAAGGRPCVAKTIKDA